MVVAVVVECEVHMTTVVGCRLHGGGPVTVM